MALSPKQAELIKATAPILQTHGRDITTLFYKNVLEEHPSLHNIFNQTNQENNHQAQALAGALYAYAAHIDNLGVLSPTVEKICQKHVSLYIQPEHYAIVGEGLLRAMGIVLGSALTPAILDAWTVAYWQLADLMIGKEQAAYAAFQNWTQWKDFRIDAKIEESAEITSFYLKPTDGQKLPDYLPGQYISAQLYVPNFRYKQSRQYSLSDAPGKDYLRISVKRDPGSNAGDSVPSTNPGWVSNVLHSDKKVGDIVELSHPAGDFFFDSVKDDESSIILLSAGVGITPMISILNTLVQRGFRQNISFIHGARDTSVQAFGEHVRQQARDFSNVRSVIFVKSPQSTDKKGEHYDHLGRLSLDMLDHDADLHLQDPEAKYFVCGPSSFMADVWRGLKSAGVDEGRIKMEVFGTGDLPSEQ